MKREKENIGPSEAVQDARQPGMTALMPPRLQIMDRTCRRHSWLPLLLQMPNLTCH